MTMKNRSDRFNIQEGFEISVQVPQLHAEPLLQAIYPLYSLRYGDYDRVSFQSEIGIQRFRSLPGGRIAATENVVEVPCVELSFFIHDQDCAREVVQALYVKHPYEEPVILIRPALRSLNRAGMDEDNPNKFWNRPPEDWVPEVHRVEAPELKP